MMFHEKQEEGSDDRPIILPPGYQPSLYDVCCGRGKKNWNHNGNTLFRKLIRNNVKAYQDSADKQEKNTVVISIVDAIRAQGGRFVRQDDQKNWYDIGDAQAREKVGHSLRDQVTAQLKALQQHHHRGQGQSSPSLEMMEGDSEEPNGGRRGRGKRSSPSSEKLAFSAALTMPSPSACPANKRQVTFFRRSTSSIGDAIAAGSAAKDHCSLPQRALSLPAIIDQQVVPSFIHTFAAFNPQQQQAVSTNPFSPSSSLPSFFSTDQFSTGFGQQQQVGASSFGMLSNMPLAAAAVSGSPAAAPSDNNWGLAAERSPERGRVPYPNFFQPLDAFLEPTPIEEMISEDQKKQHHDDNNEHTKPAPAPSHSSGDHYGQQYPLSYPRRPFPPGPPF